MNYNILRENDIRGTYPQDINKEIAIRIGKAYGTYLKNNDEDSCIIGHDNRLSSEELNSGLIEGLLSTGINITDIGLVTTPMLNYACITRKEQNGIMITASHNQKEDNGFKIFGKDYLHLRREHLEEIYNLVKTEEFTSGSGTIKEDNIKEEYLNMLLDKFPKINQKVVVDCGNGTASIIVKELYSKLFKEVTFLNCDSDGSFPIHNPDPNDENNLKWLKSVVRTRNFDLGIGIDGDADRVGIVTNTGTTIGTDLLIGIFAREIIPNTDKKKVILDVKCSCALEEDLKKIGAVPLMVKNGSAYIESVTHDEDALVGGEFSGHIFFRDKYYGYDDGLYAGLRTAELLMNKGIKADNLLDGFTKYVSTPEIRLNAPDDKKREIVEKVKKYVLDKNYNCNTSDGVRVNYTDGFALVRCSNTGPMITLRFEAKDQNTLESRQKEYMEIIEKELK